MAGLSLRSGREELVFIRIVSFPDKRLAERFHRRRLLFEPLVDLESEVCRSSRCVVTGGTPEYKLGIAAKP